MAKARAAFADSAEHLLAEMQWLDLLIRRAILDERHRSARDRVDPLKGLYVSDQEVESLTSVEAHAADAKSGDLVNQAKKARRHLDARRRASLDGSVFLALAHLSRVLALSTIEEGIVLVALAPEIDRKYERLFGWLQDDVSKKRPGVALALRLLCEDGPARLAARRVFARDVPLMRARLLHPLEHTDAPLLGQPLVLNESVTQFLFGTAIGNGLPPASRFRATREAFAALRWSAQARTEWSEAIRANLPDVADPKRRLIFHLQGPPGTGRKTLASCLCREIDARLIVIDVQQLMGEAGGVEETLRAAFLHGLLHRSAVYLEHAGSVLGEDDKAIAARHALRAVIDDLGWVAFVATEMPWTAIDLFRGHTVLPVELPGPDIAEREALWAAFAEEEAHEFASDIAWSESAAKFRLTPGQIKGALQSAANRACLRGTGAVVGRDDLHAGCHAHSSRKLAALARRLDAKATWEHITLPPSASAQLHEVCAQVRHRKTVFRDWGFGAMPSTACGLAVLFYGQSGVGKTLAVEVIANELQLEAYKIDLSTIVSKYIGETEKNLSRIFEEAEDSNAILFFDEADALFGKRSEIKDAHDRYANIEINYLLQRMDAFEGLAILATNLRKNIDDGFFRRMHFAVEFPFPDAAHRYRIWQQHLPARAPIKKDVDFGYLAERFTLSGGNIRNVVVNAAFLAAESGGEIGMEHLIRATRREYEKIGRLCTDMDFRPYQAWLTEASSGR